LVAASGTLRSARKLNRRQADVPERRRKQPANFTTPGGGDGNAAQKENDMDKLPFKFTPVPMPEEYHSDIPGHQCNHCKHQTAIGDGGEYNGTWEFYYQACDLVKDKYGLSQVVDPYSDGPDENGNTAIVTDCQLFEAQS
jgi:hypothetical protein